MSSLVDVLPALRALSKGSTRVATVVVLTVAGGTVGAQDHGVPVGDYPTWRERATVVLTNIVRMAPIEYRDDYMADWPAYTDGILGGYSAVDPVYWNLQLNQVARFHSDDVGNTDGCPISHDSCDGTSASTRVNLVYSGVWTGENMAFGSPLVDPRAAVNLWLCEISTGTCVADFTTDGHRANIMSSVHDEAGAGYAEGSNVWEDFWTLDFGLDVDFVAPSPIVAATHLYVDSGFIDFTLNYFDPSDLPPESVILVLDGVEHSMSIDTGQSYRGTYVYSEALDNSCRSYHFVVRDADEQEWLYPEVGEFRTFGEGGCTEDYVPQPTFIFGDGFEGGNTTAWSSTVGEIT